MPNMGFGIFAYLQEWTHKIGFYEKCPYFDCKIFESATFSQKSGSGYNIINSCILRGLKHLFGEMLKNGFLAVLFHRFFPILSKIWSGKNK